MNEAHEADSLLWGTQANHFNVAEPVFEGHQVGALLEQLARLVSEQLFEHFAALLAVRIQQHPQQEVTQVEDKY